MVHAVPLVGGETLYRIGVNADCPIHQIFAGGQCFPRRSQKVSGYGAETERVDLQGAYVRMQAGQLERCIEEAQHKIIRTTRGRKARARVYDKRSRNWRPMPGDMPVIQFMWFELVEGNDPHLPLQKKTIADVLKEQTSSKVPESGRRRRSSSKE